MSWETFLQSHWGVIAAADFFTVEVLTHVGLIRYFVLFVIDLRLAGSRLRASCPSQMGVGCGRRPRNLTDAYEGFLAGTRYLIHDRDPLYTREFQLILKSSGVKTVKLGRADFDRIAQLHPMTACRLVCNLVNILSERLRRMDEWITELLDEHETALVEEQWVKIRQRLQETFQGHLF